MRVVTKGRLIDHWTVNPASKPSLSHWYRTVDDPSLSWQKCADVKATWPASDKVGDCVVFNIGGNNWRLIARVRFATGMVYVLKILTHVEYDRDIWKTECGCFDEPPHPPKRPLKPSE